jgi:hypothetical protein
VSRVDVEQPAAIGAPLLDRFLAGDREEGDDLVGAFQRLGGDAGEETLRHAGGDERERRDDRDRQQHVEGIAGHIDPEIAERFTAIGGEGARHGCRYGKTDRARDEVLHGQPRHLAEAAHGRLTAIGLPVRIGDEADGGVEGQMRRQPVEALRVQRQQTLQPQHRIEQHEAGRAEGEHGAGIAEPVLALVPVDAERRVEAGLDRFQHQVERRALACPDARHVDAERPAHGYRQRDREDDLCPAPPVHARSPFCCWFRSDRGAAARRPCRPRARGRRRHRARSGPWRQTLRSSAAYQPKSAKAPAPSARKTMSAMTDLQPGFRPEMWCRTC